MKHKLTTGIMLTLLLTGMLILAFDVELVLTPLEEWVPYVPSPGQVDLSFWMVGEIAYVNVAIQFGNPCFDITTWGTILKADHNIWADSEIWLWTGFCIMIVPPPVSHTYELGHLEEGDYTFTFKAWGHPIKSISSTVTPPIAATVDIDPDTLNLKSKGTWITTYIQLPQGYTPEDIDAATISLNETIPPVLDPQHDFVTNSSKYLTDHDSDGTLERMVKFSRAEVASWIYNGLGIQYGNVTLEITGELADGTQFEGTDTIKVLFPGDADDDGDVDFDDFTILAGCYGMSIENPSFSPLADFDEDGHIKYDDFIILAGNYGKTI